MQVGHVQTQYAIVVLKHVIKDKNHCGIFGHRMLKLYYDNNLEKRLLLLTDTLKLTH